MTREPCVIVSGASRGLGAGIARMLAKLGAHVVLTARSRDALEQVAAGIREQGSAAIAVPGDITDPALSRRAVDAALAAFGRLDAIVNNAGVIEPVAPIAEADADAWRQHLMVNILGPVLLTSAALPHLRAQGGRVINISSGASQNPTTGWAAYCGSKAALNQFSRVLAIEEPAITAIAVRPGVVDTAMQAVVREQGPRAMRDADLARFIRYHEQGELMPPERPGRAIAALALHAPHDWSGEFLSWNEDRVMALPGARDQVGRAPG